MTPSTLIFRTQDLYESRSLVGAIDHDAGPAQAMQLIGQAANWRRGFHGFVPRPV